MDDPTRQTIKDQISGLEADNRQAEYQLRSKEGLLPGYPEKQRAGLENEIRGLKNFIAANKQRIRDFQRQL